MGLVLGLILLALVLGVLGLVVRALKWLIYLAVALVVVAVVRGALSRGSTRT